MSVVRVRSVEASSVLIVLKGLRETEECLRAAILPEQYVCAQPGAKAVLYYIAVGRASTLQV